MIRTSPEEKSSTKEARYKNIVKVIADKLNMVREDDNCGNLTDLVGKRGKVGIDSGQNTAPIGCNNAKEMFSKGKTEEA